ncbi:hypothetical protein U3A55_11925 [Salarchaeum sp. III]
MTGLAMTMGHDPRDVAEYARRDLELLSIIADEKGRVPDELG